MTLETGTVLNNIYRVVKLLGKGSMGNVYLVERIEDDRKFVVKELNFSPEAGLDISSAKEIFRRESEFMAKFDHHGLPRNYGVFSQNEKEYLTMDYIEGKTLEEIITSSEGPVKEEYAIKWIIELADILNYLHNSFHQPLVYRDLKPANIIIKPDGKPVLVDFGIVRYYNPDKEHDTFNYGSPGYAAPEQYKGRGRSTPQSDIFGLGVILFQMLTGYDPSLKPLQFPSMKQLNPLIDETLEGIVLRAIQLDPLKRYISVTDFKEALYKYTGTHIYPAIREEKKYVPEWYKKAKWFAAASLILPFIIIFLIVEIVNTRIMYLTDSCLTGWILLIICPVMGIAVSVSGLRNLSKKEVDISDYLIKSIGYNVAAFIIGAAICFNLTANFLKTAVDGMEGVCESNLKNLATAAENYSTDNNGLYPSDMSRLIEKHRDKGPYINEIPLCRANPGIYLINLLNKEEDNTTSYEYKVSENFKNFTIWCICDHTSAGTSQGFPQYSSVEGLILK